LFPLPPRPPPTSPPFPYTTLFRSQLHSDAVEGGDLLHQVGDDLDEDRDLFGRPCEVLFGQDVESDDLDVDLEAPAEELDDLRRSRPVPVGGGRPELPGPPPIAVGDDSDVARHRHRLVELARSV